MFSEDLLAERTSNMGSSAIREILKVVSKPGVVSLAGGLPAPEAFPIELIRELTNIVLDKYPSQALQYGTTEGFMPLREELAKYLAKAGVPSNPESINITSGSQGALDSLGKILISEGDKIAVEAPTYLGAIQAFNPYGPEYMQMETDDNGLIPESLQEVLKNHSIKFIYLVPTFQNPTGRTLPLERRKKIAEIIKEYNVLLVEDDPYSALRFRGEAVPSIRSLAPDHVLYTSTFSKTFAPGLRIGYYVAPPLIRKWLVLAKQGVDLNTSTFNQAISAEYLAGGHIYRHIPEIVKLYQPRQEAMQEAMEKHFPDSITWTKPEGGMFIWASGPKGLDITPIYNEAIEKNVAFVPGRYFYTKEGDGLETMRLNFTMKGEQIIRDAIKTLGEVIKKNL
ncbi:MAG: PLP-dependent aminotransferase family protein [Spirochaetales bacterium]|nr:PLP-dependent aminotransferase family protein [Spirochaetales bacterium]